MQKKITSTVIKAACLLSFFLLGVTKTNAQLSAGALNFDGVNDYVNVPGVNILNQLPLTIEAWVRPEARNDGSVLAEYGNNVISNDLTSQFGTGFGVVVLSNNVSGIVTAYNDGMRFISTPLTAGTWYHVSVVYTSGNVKTYLNGNLLESYNFTQNLNSSSSLIRIGKYNDDNTLGTKRFFKGDVDEVRVWNRALCQGEIQNNMNCEVSLPQNGLYSYYKFNVGLIGVLNSLLATLPDVSGNNNDGTLNDFALTGALSNWVAGKATGTCNSFTIPPATITLGGTPAICQGDSMLMTANSANAYQWYNYGVAIPGETNQTYYAKQTGEYTVVVTTGNCAITSAVQNISVNPVPSIFINSTSTSICAGIPVSMSLGGSNDAVNAASFNTVNTNDYVSIPHQSQLNPSAITVEAWVRPSQGGVDKGIVMKMPGNGSGQIGYGLRQTATNRFQFVIGSTGSEVFAQSAAQTIGPWYHLTGTYDGNVIRLYINGTLAGSAVATGAITSTTPVIVGNSNSMNQPFKGTIDELRIWNNVKTATQISCDYKIAANPASTNLVGYWRMNTASGGTTPDVTSYQNNGVVYNTTSLVSSTASVGNNYKWEPATGITNVNNACITVSPAVTTTFKGIATNSYGCSVKDSITVTVFPAGQTFNVTGGGNYCTGGAGVPIGLSGSQVGISYQLKKGASNIGGLVPGTGSAMTVGLATESGTYTVVAVNNNCTNTMAGSTTVTALSSPVIALTSITNPMCNGAATGAIDLNVSGGTQPRTYTWSNNATTEDLSNIPAGTYILNVSDVNGCKDSDTFTLTEPTAPITGAIINNVTCNGLDNGSITITTGGTAPYTYTWSNAAVTKDVFNLAPGLYHVSVEDALGCISDKTYSVAEPGILSPSLTPINISCGGSMDGAVNLAVSGGTAPYTYLWSNNATTQNISGLAAGTYSVDVTDANGCNAGAAATVQSGAALVVNGIVTDVTCFGANNGTIQLVPVTGVAPFTYLWNNNATTASISNLAPGTYNVSITDSRNCITTGSYTISQSASALVASATHTNVLCSGANTGSIDVSVSGGTAPYTYTWNNNATTQDISSLAAGTYTVAIKDAKNCIVNTTATITEPAAIQLSAVTHKAYCANGTGSIDVSVSGGTAPYTYVWNNNATTQDIYALVPGNYSVTVTDAAGCSANGTYTVADSSSMSMSGAVTNALCNGQANGAIALTVNGGVAPFTYAWNDNVTTQNRTQLAAGTYSVVVTDNGGCTVSGSFTVMQPSGITVTGDVLDVTCHALSNGGSTFDGAVYLSVSGGNAPYSFAWYDTAYYANTQDIEFLGAGNYTVNVTDNNGCTVTKSFEVIQPSLLNIAATVNNVGCNNIAGSVATIVTGGVAPYTYEWSNDSTGSSISNIGIGFYNLIVTDANGCIRNDFYEVFADSLNLTATVTNATCYGANNGAIDVTAQSSSPIVSYTWSNNAATEDLNNVGAGTYTLYAANASGCVDTVVATVAQPSAITVTATATNITCNSQGGGSISLAVSGGVAPYTYVWNNNATTQNISGLTAGIYSVVITDANGCSKTASATVGQSNTNMVITTTVTNANCGSNTGAITVAVSGGAAPYTYLWSNSATTQNLSNIGSGTYSVTVTDANGCTKTATATVNQGSTTINIAGTVTNVNCNGGNNGAVSITVSGGAMPYTYSWTGGATTKNISSKVAGTYTVTVTDANGCSATQTFTITQPAPLALSAALTHVSCNGGDNGAIDLGVSGGTGPYTYSWNLGGSNNNNCWNWWWWWCNNNYNNYNNNTTTQDVNDLSEGSYTVTVTDAKGCTVTSTYIITEPSVLAVNVTKTNVTCKDGNNGTITLNVSGGTAPYTYNWGNNITTQNRSGLVAGTYSVTVTDAKGCSKNISVSISQPSSGMNVSANVTNIKCKGNSTGGVNISVSGGNSPYTYSWTGGATTQDISNKPAGTYTVVITDNGGCSVTKTYTITEPATALSLSAVVTNISCKGGDNGAINLSVSGGNAPYSYSWNLSGSNNNNNCWNWWSWWCNNNCNNNNSNNTQDIDELEEGVYTVTVTDDNGCTVTGSYTITEPATALMVNASKTNVTCKNGDNGTITLNVTGGTAPYTYNWGNNITTQNRSNLSAGNYNVTVTDANGCSKNVSVSISQPSSGLNISGTATNVSCNGGNNGGVNISVSGGSSPYIYSWTGGATTQDISNKPASTYTVVVTDANGCSESKTYTITQPSAITASISVSPMVTVTNGQPYTIYDGYGPQSVTLSVNVTGGNGGYSYSWSPASSCSNKYSASTSVSPNSTTTYTVTITDNKGCTKTVSQTIKVVDVRCGNNNNKVIVCHNGNEICVSENAVQSHLNHGCSVGPCSNNAKGGSVADEDEDNHEEESIHTLVGKDIRVYPNPSKGIFLLELPQGVMNASVLITDMSGRIIERRVSMGENSVRFDLSKVAQGVYLIQVVSGNDRFQSRITIE